MKTFSSRDMRVALLCVAGALVSTAEASPITFTIASGSWTLGSGWGSACTSGACDASHTALNANWIIDGSLAQTFSLNGLGDTQAVTFGTATLAEEDNKIDAGEQDNLDVTGILNLTLPTTTSFAESNLAVVIATSGATDDSFDDLSAAFASVLVRLGTGEEFSVDLSNSTWDCNGQKRCTWKNPDTRPITATFTLTKLPSSEDTGLVTASVPEPATLALFSIGFFGLGFSRRKRQPKCPTQ